MWEGRVYGTVKYLPHGTLLTAPIVLLTHTSLQHTTIYLVRAGSWASTEGKRGQGRAVPLADVEQVLEEERDYTYMQNGFNVFMSNADGEGASVPEADVD